MVQRIAKEIYRAARKRLRRRQRGVPEEEMPRVPESVMLSQLSAAASPYSRVHSLICPGETRRLIW
jgi:hypothetical protein